MAEAYIVDARRTAVGRRNGGFADVHPADFAAQAGDIARTAALAAGLPENVPGVTLDRQCGSAQQAVHFAAQAVMSGTADLIVAGGVQNMSTYPILSAFPAGEPYGQTDP